MFSIRQACSDASAPLPYARHLFLYLIVDDLDNGRLLWRRVPPELRVGELAAAWDVGAMLWLRWGLQLL